MKQRTMLLPLLAAGLLVSGCVGTGPNTQRGAAGGAALGALAGAVIGNNSRGHDSVGGALVGAAIGAAVGGTLGNAQDHEQGTIYRSEYEATTPYSAVQPPPMPMPPRVATVIPAAPAGAVWVGGHYVFNGNGYMWVAGSWMYPPRGFSIYVQPHWVRRHGHGSYQYVRGYWR